MAETFVLVQEIAERWGLGYAERLALLETQAASGWMPLPERPQEKT